MHSCLLRNDCLEFLGWAQLLSARGKGQEHVLFEVINSYSSALQGERLSREDLGAPIGTKNIALAEVINNCCFLINSGVSAATVRDQHIPGNKTGKMVVVKWNFCRRRCYQRPEAFDVIILPWLLQEAKREMRD